MTEKEKELDRISAQQLENGFNHYLKLVGLDRAKLPENQIIETRRAWVAGIGQGINLLVEIADMPEPQAEEVIESLQRTVLNFFENEKP